MRLVDGLETNILRVSPVKLSARHPLGSTIHPLLGRAQPVIPPNLYSVMLINIIAWGPQVIHPLLPLVFR